MSPCERCEDMGLSGNCMHCQLGNPCLGCTDYDEENQTCTSNGACGTINEK